MPSRWSPDVEAIGAALQPLEPLGPDDDAAFEAAAQAGVEALLVASSPRAQAHRPQIVRLAARLRWPAVYYHRGFVEDDGLMSYDASLTDLWQRAATHVDKVLRGGSPAEIPIEQPMRFDFAVNLKMVSPALGVTIPQHVLLQATEVLQ